MITVFCNIERKLTQKKRQLKSTCQYHHTTNWQLADYKVKSTKRKQRMRFGLVLLLPPLQEDCKVFVGLDLMNHDGWNSQQNKYWLVWSLTKHTKENYLPHLPRLNSPFHIFCWCFNISLIYVKCKLFIYSFIIVSTPLITKVVGFILTLLRANIF